jgi:glycosyltransferase involved in cell wall biosynthesis
VRRRLRLPAKYILFVGTLEPRKNLVRLLKAYRRLVTAGACDEHLVLGGQMGWNSGPLEEALNDPVLADRVHVTGYVDDADLPALYSGARLFVYPSLEEGFGLPPLEAMACGTPVLSSNVSSTAEILEGAAVLVDPLDEAAIADGMRAILDDAQRRAALTGDGLRHAAKFRWEDVAAQTIASYEACMAQATKTGRTP